MSNKTVVSPYINELKNGKNIFQATRCGTSHPSNEDSVIVTEYFYGVADGVGGGELGDLASKTLIEHCSKLQPPFSKELILKHLIKADNIVQQELLKYNARGASMLSGIWIDKDNKGFIGNIGDSRIYKISLIKNKIKLKQISDDQTYGNLNLTPPKGRNDDDPAMMIGIGTLENPQIESIKLKENEGFLICSDGLYKFLEINKIEEICESYLLNYEKENLRIESITDILINEAIKNDSYDDVTAIIVFNYQSQSEKPKEEPFINFFTNLSNKNIKWINIKLKLLIIIISIIMAFVACVLFYNDKITSYFINDTNDTNDTNKSQIQTPIKKETFDKNGTLIDGLMKVKQNGKWGYIDENKTTIIEIKYDWVGDFDKGKAKVLIDDQFGVIDKNGSFVVQPKYDDVGDFTSHKLIAIKKNNKWGYLDENNTVVVDIIYDKVYPFNKKNIAKVVKDGNISIIYFKKGK